MKNETPDFGKKGPQYGNWIPYSLVMVSLAAALALLFAGNALKNVVGWLSSVLTVFFTQEPVTGYAQARQADTGRFAQWYRGLLARGIYAAPSQFEAMFLSAAHTDAEIGRILQAARAIF